MGWDCDLSRESGDRISGNTIDGVDRNLLKVEASTSVLVDQKHCGERSEPNIPAQISARDHDNLPNVGITITEQHDLRAGILRPGADQLESTARSMAKNITVAIQHDYLRGVISYGVLTGRRRWSRHDPVDGNLFDSTCQHAIYQNGGGNNLTIVDTHYFALLKVDGAWCIFLLSCVEMKQSYLISSWQVPRARLVPSPRLVLRLVED